MNSKTQAQKNAPRDELTQQCIDDFGDQWLAFRDNDGYYASREMMADVCGPDFNLDDIHGKRVLDVGSGTGRIVNMLASFSPAKIYAVEPSDAFAVMAENTKHHGAMIERLKISGDAVPHDLNLDYAFSIGVVHHIPNPKPVMDAIFTAMKQSGTAVIWLYGREGNGLYLCLYKSLSFFTKKMPDRALNGLAGFLNILLDGYIWLCRYIPLPMRKYALNVLAKLDRPVRKLVIFDQLNPAYAKYYTAAEARALLEDSGFTNVRLYHRHGYSWTVFGEKP